MLSNRPFRTGISPQSKVGFDVFLWVKYLLSTTYGGGSGVMLMSYFKNILCSRTPTTPQVPAIPSFK